MIIAVSVQTCWFSTRNNFCAVRQESNPQSVTAYISVRYQQGDKDIDKNIVNKFIREKTTLKLPEFNFDIGGRIKTIHIRTLILKIINSEREQITFNNIIPT